MLPALLPSIRTAAFVLGHSPFALALRYCPSKSTSFAWPFPYHDGASGGEAALRGGLGRGHDGRRAARRSAHLSRTREEGARVSVAVGQVLNGATISSALSPQKLPKYESTCTASKITQLES